MLVDLTLVYKQPDLTLYRLQKLYSQFVVMRKKHKQDIYDC